MNDRTTLADMRDDDLDDIAAAVAREQSRRVPQKQPGEMRTSEYQRWADQEIAKAERAKAEAQQGGEQ